MNLRRRQFALLAFAPAAVVLLAAPVAIRAQHQSRVYRIGFVSPTSPNPNSQFDAFRKGLGELGYSEGKNVVVEARFAEGRLERIPGLVAELIALKVDVLLAGSPVSAVAAKKASGTVPIVFAGVGDPVTTGIVSNLARPEGNVTGIAFGVSDPAFGGKWLELLKEVSSNDVAKPALVAIVAGGMPLPSAARSQERDRGDRVIG